MNVADTFINKGLIFKKGAEAELRPVQVENPYVSARRSWNSQVGAMASTANSWQVVALISLLVALASVGGMIHIGSQSKFIPYIVEIDKLGNYGAVGPINPSYKANTRVLQREVAEFIENARMVTPDVALQRSAVYRVYSKLTPNDPATQKMNEWLNGTEESSPFKRAAKEMVSVEIQTVLQQTQDTWQVDWVETLRERSGAIKGAPLNMRALITVYIADTSSSTNEETMRKNPLNIYIRDFTWTRLTN